MLDDTVVPNWVARIIEEVETSAVAEIVLYLVRAPAVTAPSARRMSLARLASGVGARWRTRLFAEYVNWDYRRHRVEPDAFAPIDIADRVREREAIVVEPITTGRTDRFSSSDLQTIRDRELDVILRFGFRILRGEILWAARYGIWSFHHGDNRFYRGGPAFFWEMFHARPICGTILQRLTERLDDGEVIHRSFSATNLTSLYATRNAAYWKAAGAVRRRLEDVSRWGWDYVLKLHPRDASAPPGPLYTTPWTPTMLLFLARLRLRVIAAKLRARLFTEKWTIGVRRRSGDEPWARLDSYRFLVPPAGHFYADPFLATRDGRTFVFFEDYVASASKGRICCAEIADGSVGAAQVVLEASSHLAYPYVFESGGEFFMTPETAARGQVELYRAASFPHDWQLEMVLASGVAAVDPTIVRVGATYWMFVGIAPHGASAEHELHAFHAQSVRGPWHAHPLNPVSSDIRSARPGGRPFRGEQDLVRPAQDCSVRYGHAITLNRVQELSTTAYVESAVQSIRASSIPNAVGTHTYDRDDRYEVIDAIIRRAQIRKGIRTIALGAFRRLVRRRSGLKIQQLEDRSP
jgi:hypothetical protein